MRKLSSCIKIHHRIYDEQIPKIYFTHHVAIEARGLSSLYIWGYICGGSILSDKYILTARTCIAPKWKHRIIHSLQGKRPLWTPDEKISSVISTNFNGQSVESLAVLTIDPKIKFDQDARPIQLPNLNQSFNKNYRSMKGYIYGYGLTTSWWPVNSLTLKIALVDFPDAEKCPSKESSICIKGRNGAQPCIGDQGGGLIVKVAKRWIILGVYTSHSSVFSCGTINGYQHYTSIFDSLLWLNKFVQ